MGDLIVLLLMLAAGYFVGSYLERKHYRSIREREETFINLPVSDLKRPLHPELVQESYLVHGSVVISIDYFKRMVAGFRNIFGGNMSTYETLLDRARREAILRMKEDAKGAKEIINLRIETASISKSDRKGKIGSVEVYAYGTALSY